MARAAITVVIATRTRDPQSMVMSGNAFHECEQGGGEGRGSGHTATVDLSGLIVTSAESLTFSLDTGDRLEMA